MLTCQWDILVISLLDVVFPSFVCQLTKIQLGCCKYELTIAFQLIEPNFSYNGFCFWMDSKNREIGKQFADYVHRSER